MKASSKGSNWISQPGRLLSLSEERHWIVVTILFLAAVGLLLIGLISDNYFNVIIFGTLLGGAIVGLWLYRHEPSVAEVPGTLTHSSKKVWKPEPHNLVPFGPYGGGQWTAHPIGLVIVVGLLLMGLVSRTPVSLLLLLSLLGGAIVGFFLWLRHR
jgi:hypothetical protein